MSHSPMGAAEDGLEGAVERIAAGSHRPADIARIARALRRSGRDVVQIGKYNYHFEHADEVVILGRSAYYGTRAENIRRVVEDLLDDMDDEIPRGTLRGPGGGITALGALVVCGTVAWLAAEFVSGEGALTSGKGFAMILLVGLGGSVTMMVGRIVQSWHRPKPGRLGGSAADTLTKALDSLGNLIFIGGIATGLASIYLTIASDAPASRPPALIPGMVVAAIGWVIVRLSKIINGYRDD